MAKLFSEAIRRKITEGVSASITGTSKSDTNNNKVEIRKDANIPNDIGGSIDIKQILLVTNNGDQIDIKGYFSDLVIEESVFSSSITGKLTIDDSAGGLEKFAIHGGEILILKICKPNVNDIIIWREDLIVTKISKTIVSPLNLMNKFDLFFTSKSSIRSLKKNLFKSYNNISVLDAVHSIYQEMSQNDIVVEDPKITLQKPFISTGINPHKAIDYLAQRSCSKDKYFVFFERFVPVFGNYSGGEPFTATHYFGSVEKLIKDSQNNPTKTIVFGPKLNALFEGEIIRSSKYEKLENFNHINGMLFGFYNTTISSIDPIKRTHNVQKLNYSESADETKDFYSNKLFGSLNIFNTYDDKKNEIPGRKLILSSINDPISRESWLKNHIYGQLSKSMFKISVTIQGGTNTIGIGEVVNFAVPSQVSIMLNPQSGYPELDSMYSGRYLVTSVFHSLSSSQYIKTMQLSRGSSSMNLDKHTEYDSSFDDIKEQIRKSMGDRRTQP
jgi:hypothetical protein